MGFRYKNLSKSLLCMLIPMLVACVGKSGAKNETQHPAAPMAELHTPEMDSVLTAYNYEMDSLDALHNRMNIAADVYCDIVNIFGDDYIRVYKKDTLENYKEALLEHIDQKQAILIDSAMNYSYEYGRLGRNKKYFTNIAMEPLRLRKAAPDSITALYNRAVIAEQCYMNTWRMVLDEYQELTRSKLAGDRYANRHLINYNAQKLLELSDSVAVYRARQQQLLAKKVEMQKTK